MSVTVLNVLQTSWVFLQENQSFVTCQRVWVQGIWSCFCFLMDAAAQEIYFERRLGILTRNPQHGVLAVEIETEIWILRERAIWSETGLEVLHGLFPDQPARMCQPRDEAVGPCTVSACDEEEIWSIWVVACQTLVLLDHHLDRRPGLGHAPFVLVVEWRQH